jgi:gamma-glutamyltranspeptidase
MALAAGDTTYFCTADGDGNAVSGVQSINSGFGSGIMAGDTGILLNNRLDPGHPNRLQSGRRVRHTTNPPLVLRMARCGASSVHQGPTIRYRSICRC